MSDYSSYNRPSRPSVESHRTCATDLELSGEFAVGEDLTSQALQCGSCMEGSRQSPLVPHCASPHRYAINYPGSAWWPGYHGSPAHLGTQLWFETNLELSRSCVELTAHRPDWINCIIYFCRKKIYKNLEGCNGLEEGCANQFHNECISLWSPLPAHNRIEAVFCFAEISTFKTRSGFIISARACTFFLIHCCKIQRDRTAQKITAKM